MQAIFFNNKDESFKILDLSEKTRRSREFDWFKTNKKYFYKNVQMLNDD